MLAHRHVIDVCLHWFSVLPPSHPTPSLSTQDTVTLRLTKNPDYTPSEAGSDTSMMLTSARKVWRRARVLFCDHSRPGVYRLPFVAFQGRFTCPITGLDTNGRNRYVGCVAASLGAVLQTNTGEQGVGTPCSWCRPLCLLPADSVSCGRVAAYCRKKR